MFRSYRSSTILSVISPCSNSLVHLTDRRNPFQQENSPVKYQVFQTSILATSDYDDDTEEEDCGDDDQEGEDEGRKMTGGWCRFQITDSQSHGGQKQIIP